MIKTASLRLIFLFSAILCIGEGHFSFQLYAQSLDSDVGLSTTDSESASSAPQALSAPKDIVEKELEVAVGIDEVLKLDFEFSPKVTIGSDQFLQLVVVPQRREVTFKGLKPGKTNVDFRDKLGDIVLRYLVNVTASGKSNQVSEIRDLLRNVEGLEVGILGGQVFVGGELVVPSDITRVNTVLEKYPDVLRFVVLSPQTQRVIARKMMDELARNNLKDVTVRVVNRIFWLEGVVSSESKKKLANDIVMAYMPDRIAGETKGLATVQRPDILDLISVNEKKDPPPAPKQVKITSQFVELAKNYTRLFGFKWAPLMGEDQSTVRIGRRPDGSVTTNTAGEGLSAVISNLFPKLNSARNAGYARIVQSGMVITKDTVNATISKQTTIPFALGTGDFTRPSSANVGFNMQVKPTILEEEKIEMQIGIGVTLNAGVNTGGEPITTTNNISTNVVVKSKESSAIGGVVQNSTSTNYDKDDPAPSQGANVGAGGAVGGGLGAVPPAPLFRIIRSKNHQIGRNQYVMFITPEIIESASQGTEEVRKKFRRRNR